MSIRGKIVSIIVGGKDFAPLNGVQRFLIKIIARTYPKGTIVRDKYYPSL